MKTMELRLGRKQAGVVILPILMLACCFLLGSSLTEAMGQEKKPIENLLPPDTLLLVGTEDVSLAREYGETMPLYKILKEQEVVDFLEKPKEFVKKAWAGIKEELSKDEAFRNVDFDLNRFLDADMGQSFFAITHLSLPEEGAVGPMAAIPDIGLVFGAEYRNPDQNLIQFAKTTLVSIANAKGFPLTLSQEEYEGIPYELANLPIPIPVSPCFFKVGDLDVFSTSTKSMQAILDLHLGRTVESLGSRSDFAEGMKHAGYAEPAALKSYGDASAMSTYLVKQLTALLGMSAMAYNAAAGEMSAEESQLHRILDDFPAKLEKLMDLMGFKSAGNVFVSELSKNGMAVYSEYTTFNGTPKGFWALSPDVPFSKEKLKMIPKEAVTFSIGQFDIPGLYDLLMDSVKIVDESIHAKVQGVIDNFCCSLASPDNGEGFDLRQDMLGSLGTEMVVYKLKSQGMAMMGPPPMIFMIEMKDYGRFIGALESMISGLGNIEPEIGSIFSFKGITYEGHSLNYITFNNMPIPFNPCFAEVGDYMVFSFGLNDVKKMIKTFGKSETSILDNEDFMKYFKMLPQGQELLSISYTNVAEEIGSAYEQITPMIPLLTMGLPADLELPVDFMLLPTSESITKHLFSSIAACYKEGGGYKRIKYGPFGPEVGRVVVPAIGAGVVAAIVMWAKVEKSESLSIDVQASLPDEQADPALQAKKDLGSLAGACMVYKIEYGSYPERLEDLLVPTDAYPEGFYPPKKLPVDPWGKPYNYALKAVNPLPKIVEGNNQYMIWSCGPNGIDEFGEGDDIFKLK